MYEDFVTFVRKTFNTDDYIPLHEPRFWGNEKRYINEALDSTFVSSVGVFVDRFEQKFAEYVDAEGAVACMNGTAALHTALILAEVNQEDEVITQPLTFVATCNAISYQKAHPVFVDVDKDTMGLSPTALVEFLEGNATIENNRCINKKTGRTIKAVVPMHTFGHACRIDEIAVICKKWKMVLIEDAAECLGSAYKGQALGTFGDIGVYSFNGNKIITTGGGGMVITKERALLQKAKHITTTAKVPHEYMFDHDSIGYNYRMPNINAALGCAQLEQMDFYLKAKRKLANEYNEYFKDKEEKYVNELRNSKSNFWLNAILLKDKNSRDDFLNIVNKQEVMVRPTWTLMNKLVMFKKCQTGTLDNSEWLSDRLVNIPSSVLPEKKT